MTKTFAILVALAASAAVANDAPPPKATADVIDVEDDTDGGLVETPEDKPKRPRRSRAKPAAAAEPEQTEEASQNAAE